MPTKRCPHCAKRSYNTQVRAITVALRCSRLRGTALRVYHCPYSHGWHLTRRPAWRPPAGSTTTSPRRGAGYRRIMAALLAERLIVDETALVMVAAEYGDPRYSVSSARAVIDAWCVWGLAYPDNDQVIAADLASLRYIAEYGWGAWLAERSQSRSYA